MLDQRSKSGEPVPLATSGTFLQGITVDASCVYWTVDSSGQEAHNGEVWRAPKDTNAF